MKNFKLLLSTVFIVLLGFFTYSQSNRTPVRVVTKPKATGTLKVTTKPTTTNANTVKVNTVPSARRTSSANSSNVNQQGGVQTVIIKPSAPKAATNECKPLDVSKMMQVLDQKIANTMRMRLDVDNGEVSINGVTKRLTFDRYKVSKVGNDWEYFVNDVNSYDISAEYKDNKFLMKVKFEADGSEIKGRCPGCRFGKDNRAPDVQWENPALHITLTPTIENGKMVLTATDVRMPGDISLNGLTDTFFPGFPQMFRNTIHSKVGQNIREILSSNSFKTSLNREFEPLLNSLNLSSIKRVDMTNSSLYLCNY